jgi:hypothetical protein
MANTTTKQTNGEGRYIAATLVYGKRYRVFGKLFLKGVPQEVTEEQARALKTLKALPPGRDIPAELLRPLERFKIANVTKRPAAPSAAAPEHRGTHSTQDAPIGASA